MSIIIAILIFSFIVMIHEFGHFLLAKKCGVVVNEFSLGMGPRILSFEKGGTRYSWKLLPFGGSCAMEGEDDDSDSEGSFQNKNVWARIAIVAAGPVFNFLLAFVLSVVIISWFGYDPSVIAGTIEGYPAEEAGLQDGDQIVKMNHKRIFLFREISVYNQLHQGETVEVVYTRDGEEHTTTIEPQMSDDGFYYLGVTGGDREKGNVFQILWYSCLEVRYWICTTYESLGQLLSGRFGLNDISGPVGIVSYIGDTYEASMVDGIKYIVANMINIAILLTANLGVMNLLPIPALDGGRLVFLLVEAVTRKRLPTEIEGKIHFVGLMLLLALMAVIMFNDIRRLF